MPIYNVGSLDVWGNAAEGFTINNEYKAGHVYIYMGLPGDENDRDVIEALIEDGRSKPSSKTVSSESKRGITTTSPSSTTTRKSQSTSWRTSSPSSISAEKIVGLSTTGHSRKPSSSPVKKPSHRIETGTSFRRGNVQRTSVW